MSEDAMDGRRGAGGTEGGIRAFLCGLVMASAGAYLLTSRVVLTTGGWRIWGVSSFGLSLIPFLAGVALLFFNGRNPLGWLLTLAGTAIIFAGILMNLDVYFQPTSLFNTLMMLGLLMGGIGLIARSLLPWR